MTDEWVDEAYGPPLASGQDEWVDEAYGAPQERSWGDTGLDLAKSLGSGALNLGATMADLNPFSATAPTTYGSLGGRLIDYLRGKEHIPTMEDFLTSERSFSAKIPETEKALGLNVDTSQMSTPERYSMAGARMVPAAVFGGGIPSAFMAGAGGEIAKDFGAPELVGQVIGGGIPALTGKTLRSIGGGMAKEANALERSIYGGRASDFVSSGKRNAIVGSGADASSKLANSMKEVTEEGLASGAKDYGSLLSKANDKIDDLYSEINPIIKRADDLRGGMKIYPKYKNAEDFIKTQPAAERQTLRDALDEIKAAHRAELDGSVMALQEEKQGLYSKVYGQNKEAKETLNKYVSRDLKEAIEGVTDAVLPKSEAGFVKETNRRIGNYLDVKPIIKRALTASESDTLGKKLISFMRTSGGYGVPTIAATSALGPAGLVVGPAIGLGAQKLLFTPAGKALSSKALKGAAYLTKGMGGLLTKEGGAKAAAIAGGLKSLQEPLNEKFKWNDSKPDSENLLSAAKMASDKINPMEAPKIISAKRISEKEIEPLVEAVIQQESGGNPKAVSKVGAQGLMQLMPKTGRELFKKAGFSGEYDPFDAEQNRKLGTMYLKQLLQKYDGDIKLALASFNYGMGRIDKILKQNNANTFEEIQRYLPQETKSYVPSILTRLYKRESTEI